MKKTKFHILILLCSILTIHLNAQQQKTSEPKGVENVAYQWGKMALNATAKDTERFKPRPTITSRYLGLIFTAIFDAWSRFDENAVPVYLTDIDRIPLDSRTLKNREIAISYAAFGAMKEYYYSDTEMFRAFMKQLGYDPDNESVDPTTPEGIGNLAAKAVIRARRKDGSNQYGTAKGANGVPYFDYTAYSPVNTADENTDIDRWQPKYFSDGKGGTFAPGCLTPYWQNVTPIALQSSEQFRPGPPPLAGSRQLEKEVKEVIEMQAKLTDKDKALVEFMRDGPQSVQQAGHWLKFAQDVSIRDNHTLDEDVKMYFLTELTAMDAFIASWDAKMFYDSARPFAQVHYYFKDQMITAWAGPGKGMVEMKGEDWRPYSPEEFLCPPFPSYVSGHSTISGACAEALRLFTGADYFGEEVVLTPGRYTEIDSMFYGEPVTIQFPTFTETAEMAGISRVMGGYHIQADNVAGLELGRNVAAEAWKFYNKHLGKEVISE